MGPDSVASWPEPNCKLETQPVAMDSAALALDSNLPAKPQFKKWPLKAEGAPVSKGATKRVTLVSPQLGSILLGCC